VDHFHALGDASAKNRCTGTSCCVGVFVRFTLQLSSFQVLGIVLCQLYTKEVIWFGTMPILRTAISTGPRPWKNFWKVG